MNLIQFSLKFNTEEACKKHIEQMRWPNGVTCPHCNSAHVYVTNRGFKCGNKECHKKFTVTVGTFLESSKIPLVKWFLAMYISTAHKKGISSYQLGRDLGITQRAAWFMLQRIRGIVTEKNPAKLKGVIQADETFIGGKEKNKHLHKRTPGNAGRSVVKKSAVFGMRDLSGQVRAFCVSGSGVAQIQPIIRQNVVYGSLLMTDTWVAYHNLSVDYNHVTINHNTGEYVRGFVNTNGIENFWSLLKRGIDGIYHHVSPKHLHRYVNEFAFRYNTRKLSDSLRVDFALAQCTGRLKFKELTANP